MNVVFEGQLTGQRLLKEMKCRSLTIHTNELNSEQKEGIEHFHNQHVVVMLSDTPFSNGVIEAVEKFKTNPDEKYTPSQKLRFAIIDWAQRTGVEKEEWDRFYREKIEVLTDYVNNKDKEKAWQE